MHAKDDALVYHIERNWKGADLDAQDTAMLAFVEKLNLHPGKIEQDDVNALRETGFDDRGVLDVIMVTAMFNFMNRLADGVGIRAEDKFRKLKERKDAEVEGSLQAAGRLAVGAGD